MPLTLSSAALEERTTMPRKYAADGEDISPPLAWQEVPEGTKSFALVLDSHSEDGVRTHWIIYNMHGSIRDLPEDVPRQDTLRQWTHDGMSVRQGRNDFDRVGYTGPQPSTRPPHNNTFTLYALDAYLHVPAGCQKADLLGAMQGHVLEQAELTFLYTA